MVHKFQRDIWCYQPLWVLLNTFDCVWKLYTRCLTVLEWSGNFIRYKLLGVRMPIITYDNIITKLTIVLLNHINNPYLYCNPEKLKESSISVIYIFHLLLDLNKPTIWYLWTTYEPPLPFPSPAVEGVENLYRKE